MNSLQNFDYNGQLIQRRDDGFINLTQMAKANGKRLDHFMKARKTQGYIDALTQSLQMGVLDSERGGTHDGTWGHPSLAINLARWLSDEFAVWCDAHIFNLMETGSTSLEIDPIEEMKLKIQLAQLEAQKEASIAAGKNAELQLIQFRHYAVNALPKPIQLIVLGHKEVIVPEYRDRVYRDEELIHDGSTINKAELCDRYNIKTKKGKPDYKKLNKLLNNADLPSEAWTLTASIQSHQAFNRDYLGLLDRLFTDSDRQLNLGE
jgi:hypothetical protein